MPQTWKSFSLWLWSSLWVILGRKRSSPRTALTGEGKNSQHTTHLAASTRLHRESREFSEACWHRSKGRHFRWPLRSCRWMWGKRGDRGTSWPHWHWYGRSRPGAASTGCQPARPRLLSRKPHPVTSTQCSPTHKPSTSLLTDIKICSDKLSATAEIWSDVDFSNCLDRPRHEANLFLSTVIADADLRQEGPVACEKR